MKPTAGGRSKFPSSARNGSAETFFGLEAILGQLPLRGICESESALAAYGFPDRAYSGAMPLRRQSNSRRIKILEQVDPRALVHRYEQEAKKGAARPWFGARVQLLSRARMHGAGRIRWTNMR